MARVYSVLLILGASAAIAGPPELDTAVAAYVFDMQGTAAVVSYRWSRVDLNGDPHPDAVVLITDPDYCGSGGCNLAIFKGKMGSFDFVSYSTLAREPILVLPEKRHGWHTLSILVAGGGLDAHQALLRFDGEKYPKNPTLQNHAGPHDLEGAEKLILE